MGTIAPLKTTLAQLFQRQPPSPPDSPVDPENQPPNLVLPIEQPLPLPNVQQQQKNLDFPILVVAFCLTSVVEIAIGSPENHTVYPLSFHLLRLMILFAFASIFVAKYIAPKKPNAARLLESVGVFFGVTAFFLAVTTSFPQAFSFNLTNSDISFSVFTMGTIAPSKKTLAQLFQRQPPSPPDSPIDPENQPPNLVLPIEQPLPLPNVQQQQQKNLDFPILVVAFCLTSVVEIAIGSLENHTVYPLSFHLLRLMIVFAFASIFVAKYIAPKKPNAARLLESVGVFFGVTAFFLAVTISFPRCLMIISWIIYALSLLAILLCNFPRPLPHP
ncbi:hypothetical protein RHGRI_027650 [Rhododendron griersonianum]|uniref:Uncharacterized protein n=1 Tax=Rhododendron griersonianum TaxID=479676 RepID=A0AAV6J0W6_9ERIC|nr:hypothetical protein RHGRI_027650 [Rhododendron griersonianum]